MLKPKKLATDILIIGGGTAGCYAALTIAEHSNAHVTIAEKANIKRSGCLAAGVNALNAYINKGETPESYVDYVKKDANGIIREDLVYTIAKGLNQVTEKIESLGLPVLKDAQGNYVPRGKRSIKINGERIKPILAAAVLSKENIQVLNRVNIIDYMIKDGRVIGAYGFSLDKNIFYAISAKAVICATGGASGLYAPNNPGFSRHKMWYSPFNTGAGYAMGIRAGAEMTTFEMRFIALRCKDTIAPTGTIAQGVKAKQVNRFGQEYIAKYGPPTTPTRLYATVMENRKGLGPCYLKTTGITEEEQQGLYKAYLNMAPAQTLKWIEQDSGPRSEDVEIEGTEPYIVGGHGGSGYWVDINRATTLPGLYAAGDVAGGSPKKYVTGCFVEGEIAARAALKYIVGQDPPGVESEAIKENLDQLHDKFTDQSRACGIEEIEQAMQKVMDEYAGGISTDYAYNAAKLQIAKVRIDELLHLANKVKAKDLHELKLIYEVLDRLCICQVVIAHLEARKETRWRCYQENVDYPETDNANWLKYVNSVYKDGQVKVIFRNLTARDEHHEHHH
ncbi:MAG: adenylyl-sulfate reductase subunit alpha [Bacillota bacterium]